MAKLSTEIARELFMYGPAGGKRVTSVKELVRLSGASERAIHAHMPDWKRESEELASCGKESGLVLSLSTSALESHKKDVEFMRSEVDRLKTHLAGLSPTDETYCTVSRAMLSTQRQWCNISGVASALDAASARMKETEKLAAKAEARQVPEVLPKPVPHPLRSGVFARPSLIATTP